MTTVASRINDDPESQIRKSQSAIVQGEFATRTNAKGFFEDSFLQQEDNTWLAGAVKAYRLFIKLVLMPHMPKVYPTYAVDIVWHTHQLGPEYKKQMLDMVGVFVDHRSHDEIAPTSAAFDAARDAWVNMLYASGLPPLEAQPIGSKRANSPAGCSSSASQTMKEDSILAIKFFDETDSFEEATTQIPSLLELKEALAE